MARLESLPKLDMEIVLRVNEAEARALEALGAYGEDAFVDAFYSRLGTSCMKPHEDALRSVLKAFKAILPGELARFEKARAVFYGKPESVGGSR
jgi:hypothetical protein